MKKSQRIDKVRAIAKSEEQLLSRDVGESQRKLDDEIGRLEELKAYRLGYEKRQAKTASIPAAQWQDYQRFLQRLDTAVRAQTQVVLDGRQMLDMHRRRWMSKRQRLESLGRVVDRFSAEESAEEERRTQKLMDELSSSGRYRIE